MPLSPRRARAPRRSLSTPRRASGRRGHRRRCREPGSSRSAARSRCERSRAASQSPRGCRRCGPLPRARPVSRSMQTSSGTWRSSTTSSGRSSSSSRSSSASAWAAFRGKPSSTNPFCASSSESRSRMRPIVKSSGTRSPGRENRLDLEAERRPRSDRRPEHVPRGDVGNAVLRRRCASPACPCRSPWGPRSRDERHRRYFRKPS